MKTIEEEAEKYAGVSEDKYANKANKYCAFDMSNAFEAGFELAQRFIPVKEELPVPLATFNGLSEVVIVKSKHLADEVSAYYDHPKEVWRISPNGNMLTGVTHWRPINRKHP